MLMLITACTVGEVIPPDPNVTSQCIPRQQCLTNNNASFIMCITSTIGNQTFNAEVREAFVGVMVLQ